MTGQPGQMKTGPRAKRETPASDARDETLRAMLETRRATLAQRIRDGIRDVRAATGGATQPLNVDDGAVREGGADIEIALMQAASETLRALDAALGRLAVGRYGNCTDCGDPIAPSRLEALPFAARCVECESAREGQRAAHSPSMSRRDWAGFSATLERT